MSLCVVAACVTGPALGDVFGDNGRRITNLHVTQDESSGRTDYASLTLYDHIAARPGGGWLDATCMYQDWSARPTAEADLLVQTAQRRPADDTETFRIRIDQNAPHGWEADTHKQDFPEDEGRPASFATAGDVPDELVRKLIAELATGKRMIAQIGDLAVVTLDLDAAKADVVEFRNACEGMWRDFLRSPRMAARIEHEEIDPFTDEGRVSMVLHHRLSHDGSSQPRVSVACRGDEKERAVVLWVSGLDEDQRTGGRDDGDEMVRLRVDSDAVRELALKEVTSGRFYAFALPLKENRVPLIDRLVAAQSMALDCCGIPLLRFDLAMGRPVIADFRAKCRTVLEAAGGR